MSLKFLSEMFEILGEDIAQTQVTNRRYGGNFNWNKAAEPVKGELGRGAFSRVTPDQDPHLVNKQSVKPSSGADKDGFAAFVNYLKQHDLMDNIHFPKVYSANTTQDRSNSTRHKFQMERLIDPRSLSEEELSRLCDANFTDRLMERSVEEMAFAMERSVKSPQMAEKYIASESLAEALRIIKAASDETDHALDLNKDNWMVRRTSTGLQIVITDPLGYPKARWSGGN